MRFEAGIGYRGHRRARGPGRREYRMSPAAYRARLGNLVRWHRPRTYAETRRLEIEIALGAVRGEGYRAMARRLGCSHVYCRKVASRHRNGLIRGFPGDEQGLVAVRNLLADSPVEAVLEPPVRTLNGHAAWDASYAERPRSNPYQVIAHAMTLREWQQRERRGGTSVRFRVGV